MDAGHRKIELQSADDLTFLVQNARRAATAHLDEAFPPIQGGAEGGKDEMRARIEELVEQYIAQVFTDASPNLAINGMDIPSMAPYLSSDPAAAAEEDLYEPFDERKRQRLVDLAAEEEDLLRDIAALKRRVPRDAAARFAEGARAGLRDDEDALARRVVDIEALARVQVSNNSNSNSNSNGIGTAADGSKRLKSVAPSMMAGVPVLSVADPTMDGREDEVRRGFADAVGRLARLKKDMAAVVARMERAKSAGEYVVAKSG